MFVSRHLCSPRPESFCHYGFACLDVLHGMAYVTDSLTWSLDPFRSSASELVHDRVEGFLPELAKNNQDQDVGKMLNSLCIPPTLP